MSSSKRYSVSEEMRLALEPVRIARRLGARMAGRPDGAWLEEIAREISGVQHLLSPRICSSRAPVVSIDGERIVIEGGPVIRSGNLSRLLSSCHDVSLFLLTVGEELDDLIDTLSHRPSRQIILDAIGSEAAESTARWFQSACESEARVCGHRVTPRFSPGYGDFSLDYQEWFVENLGADLGVRLEGSMLIPRKSVSGVIGWMTS